MSRRDLTRAARGFSLLELAVTLAIIGMIGLVLWQALPRFKSQPAIGSLTETSLATAADALRGFVLANGRLPCPATTSGGSEASCDAGGQWLPARTLGLNLSQGVRYALYRNPTGSGTSNVDLGATSDKFVPNLPPGSSSNQSNGLDFCENLRNLMRAPGTVLTAGTSQIPIAYGLALAGMGDADGDGNPFDGLNAQAGRFELGGTPTGARYDDMTLTTGAGQLFADLGCVSRQSAASGLAKAAYAAYDIDRYALAFVDFRTFQVRVRENNKRQAETNLAMAIVDMLNAVATSAESVAIASETAGVGAGTVIAAAGAVTAAGVALAAAAVGVYSATEALGVANQQLAAARVFQAATAGDLNEALQKAQLSDSKGLLP